MVLAEFVKPFDSTCNFLGGRILKWGEIVPNDYVNRNNQRPNNFPILVVENIENAAGCMQAAANMLDLQNKFRNNPNDVSQADRPTFDALQEIAYDMYGDKKAKIPNAYWTLYQDSLDGPYNYNCVVSFSCQSTTQFHPDPRYAVSGELGTDYDGFFGACTIPIDKNCEPNAINGEPVDKCFGLTSSGDLGLFCRTRYDQMPDSSGSINKERVLIDICDSKKLSFHACACQNRTNDSIYNKWIRMVNMGAINPGCWYFPCHLSGNDRLVSPEIIEGRKNCQGVFCQNFINLANNDATLIDDLKATVNCDFTNINNGGGGGGTGGGSTGAAGGGSSTTTKPPLNQTNLLSNANNAANNSVDPFGIMRAIGMGSLSTSPVNVAIFYFVLVFLILLIVGGAAFYLAPNSDKSGEKQKEEVKKDTTEKMEKSVQIVPVEKTPATPAAGPPVVTPVPSASPTSAPQQKST